MIIIVGAGQVELRRPLIRPLYIRSRSCLACREKASSQKINRRMVGRSSQWSRWLKLSSSNPCSMRVPIKVPKWHLVSRLLMYDRCSPVDSHAHPSFSYKTCISSRPSVRVPSRVRSGGRGSRVALGGRSVRIGSTQHA